MTLEKVHINFTQVIYRPPSEVFFIRGESDLDFDLKIKKIANSDNYTITKINKNQENHNTEDSNGRENVPLGAPSKNMIESISQDDEIHRPVSPLSSESILSECALRHHVAESCYDTFLRHGNNLKNIVYRNGLSVFGQTALREYLKRSLIPLLLQKSPAFLAPTLSIITIAIPIIWQLIGLLRDYQNGTQTKETISARITMILMGGISGTALIATGGLNKMAPTLISALAGYVLPRDVTQYFLLLKNNNSTNINMKSTVFSAAAYGVNQVAVGTLSEFLVEIFKPYFGELGANIFSCALANVIGEVGDEVVNANAKAFVEKNPSLEIKFQRRPEAGITVKTAADTLFNTAASRSSLFTSLYAASAAVNLPGVNGNLFAGLMLAVGYVPFFYTHAQKQKTLSLSNDIELSEITT